MAKSSNKGSSGSGLARFRLVILEGELPEGSDVNQFTQAMQTALRPPENQGNVRRIAAPQINKVTPGNGGEALNTETIEAEDVVEVEESEEPTAAAQKRPKSARKVRSPKVVDVELNEGEMPFAKFANQKNATSHAKKNLVVAAWFKLHRDTSEIGMDHVYTCYMAMNWSTNMEDFGFTLRSLKAKNLFDGGKGDGLYAINHIGLDRVRKMGQSAP